MEKKKKSKKIDENAQIFLSGKVKKIVRIRADQTLNEWSKYLSEPPKKDFRGWKRYSLRQIRELVRMSRTRMPERWVDKEEKSILI